MRSVIRFQVRPGCEAAFEAAFAEAGMLARRRKALGRLLDVLIDLRPGALCSLVAGSGA